MKFEETDTDMLTTNDLRSYLDQTNNPNIVLRVENSENNPTQENTATNFSSVYNTIEKELLRAGFNVRDRALFNQVLSRTDNETNYSELQSQTDTDLILELVNINTKTKFTTNIYYTDSGEQKTFENNKSLSAYGAKIEFKVVLIKNNQFAGSYLFYYQPCPEGCPIKISNNTKAPRFVDKKIEEDEEDDPYQYVSKSAFEAFIKDATQKLIGEMRSAN